MTSYPFITPSDEVIDLAIRKAFTNFDNFGEVNAPDPLVFM